MSIYAVRLRSIKETPVKKRMNPGKMAHRPHALKVKRTRVKKVHSGNTGIANLQFSNQSVRFVMNFYIIQ